MPADIRTEPQGDGAGWGNAGDLLELANARPAWHADAACREHPELDWFTADPEMVDECKAICGGCLVRRECEGAALALPAGADRDGISGGYTPKERAKLRRGRYVAPPAPPRREAS